LERERVVGRKEGVVVVRERGSIKIKIKISIYIKR
jgi:hypothetical protein